MGTIWSSHRISPMYNPPRLLSNSEINKNPSCIVLYSNKYWYVNPSDNSVESSRDKSDNNNINTDLLEYNNDVKIGKVRVVIAMYETKEILLSQVEAENTIDKEIFSIIDVGKLKYSAKHSIRSELSRTLENLELCLLIAQLRP